MWRWLANALLQLLLPIRLCIAPVARGLLYLINNSLRILGPCLVVLAFGLISFFTCEVLYIRFIDPPRAVWSWPVYAFIDILVLANLFRSYYHALAYGPGITPLVDPLDGGSGGDVLSAVPPVCRKCVPQRFKLPRAHHCSTCGICIRRMDHHCPWLNQCVGEGNYHYFLIFLLWAIVSTAYALQTLAPAFYSVVISGDLSSPLDDFTETQEYYLTMGFILALAIFLAVTSLAGLHCYLIAVDKTSLELQLFGRAEAAGVDTIYESLRKTEVFGVWAILTTRVTRTGNQIVELELEGISV